jgi:endo-1,4-beta-xylanase
MLLPLRLMLFISLCLLTTVAQAENAPPDLLAPGGWTFTMPHPGDAMQVETPTAGKDNDKDYAQETLTVTAPATPFYLIQLVRGIPTAVPEGRRLELRFAARSATKNPMRVTVEKNGPPYTGALDRDIVLSSEWRSYTLTGLSLGYGQNGLSAHFQVGQQAGVIELRDIHVTDIGPDPAMAAAAEALRPKRIQARIEKYRKGTLTVRVVNREGQPVKDVTVKITQTRHAFLFGCNVFGYDPNDMSAAQKAYRDEFAALFNYATVPFYWGAFEETQGKPDYARLQTMADWCLAHGITPKGHPLVWHEVWPGWAPNDPDAAIPLLRARVAAIVPHYAKTIHYWDVLNEANGAASFQPPNGESRWIERDGPAPVVETALGWARAAGQGLPETFLYNDYDTGDNNLALLTRLQADGKLPDAIGLQSHMHDGVWPPAKIWAVCENFSRFGKPIHFTETTVLSGPRRTVDFNGPYPTDWNTTPDGEAAQADYVTQFYTILFSHPALRAITWWDFSDKNAWLNAPAGLVRRDMTPKPAYTRLLNLIHKTWWTDTLARTNQRGAVTARVFYGAYALTATDTHHRTVQRTVFFPESAPPLSVTLWLP